MYVCGGRGTDDGQQRGVIMNVGSAVPFWDGNEKDVRHRQASTGNNHHRRASIQPSPNLSQPNSSYSTHLQRNTGFFLAHDTTSNPTSDHFRTPVVHVSLTRRFGSKQQLSICRTSFRGRNPSPHTNRHLGMRAYHRSLIRASVLFWAAREVHLHLPTFESLGPVELKLASNPMFDLFSMMTSIYAGLV